MKTINKTRRLILALSMLSVFLFAANAQFNEQCISLKRGQKPQTGLQTQKVQACKPSTGLIEFKLARASDAVVTKPAYDGYKAAPIKWQRHGNGANPYLYMTDKILVAANGTETSVKIAEGTFTDENFPTGTTLAKNAVTGYYEFVLKANTTYTVYAENAQGATVKTITIDNVRDGLSNNKPFLIVDYARAGGTIDLTDFTLNMLHGNSEYSDVEMLSKHFEMYENINMNTSLNPQYADAKVKGNWLPNNGLFTGSFDGNNKTINNMIVNVDDADCVIVNLAGFAGYGVGMFAGVGGSVSNLTLAGGSITNGVTNSSSSRLTMTGSIAGTILAGTIENCHNTGTVGRTKADAHQGGVWTYVGGIIGVNFEGSVIDCSNMGDVYGVNTWVGGITGSNVGVTGGTVEKCYNFGNVFGAMVAGGISSKTEINNVISSCFNAGKISAINAAGGIVGDITQGAFNATGNRIENCYNTGAITTENIAGGIVGAVYVPTFIKNCYNTGNINTTGSYAGGIVGNGNNNVDISNCYALNSSVDGSNAARISSLIKNSMNNYAINTMLVNGNTVAGDDGAGINGKNINFTEATDKNDIHYINFNNWNFNDTWTFTYIQGQNGAGADANLPILKAFLNKTEQNPYILESKDRSEPEPDCNIVITPSAIDVSYLAHTPAIEGHLNVACDGGGAPGAWMLTVPASVDWLTLSLHSNGSAAASSISGTGAQSVYLVVARNYSDYDRETNLLMGANPVAVVRQEGQGGSADRIAVEGTGGNAKLVITRDPRNAGAYFKFGSIVAINSRSGGMQDLAMARLNVNTINTSANYVAFKPTTLNITIWGGTNSLANGVPGYSFNADGPLTSSSDNSYHNLANVQKGKGDPCRCIGMTANEISSFTTDAQLYAREAELAATGEGGWRMPTNDENKAITQQELNSVSGNPNTPFWTAMTYPGTTHGNVPGVIFPNAENGLMRTFLPANGYINTTPNINNQGVSGNYWLSNPVNPNASSNIYYMTFTSGTFYTHSATGGSEAMGVRCVRKEQ